MNNTYLVPTLFGLEGIVARELGFLDAENIKAYDGKVTFEGDFNTMARANIAMRSGERVLLVLGEFKAVTFDELFEGIKALPWEEYIGKDDCFPVKGYSLNSALFSVPDCQAIIKKAAVERLKRTYKTDWFSETGPKKQIQFSIQKDIVTVMLDTSGEGLHKRGYRVASKAAPLRETLAAAMVSLSRYRNGEIMLDPFCGSGTIGIEAALYATYTAPNLKRSFAAEKWTNIDEKVWREERERAISKIKPTDCKIFCSDIDDEAVSMAGSNAKRAGVSKHIEFSVCDARDIKPTFDGGVIIANPPYGERLMEMEEAIRLYKSFGKVYKRFNNTRAYILTSHEDFESQFGIKADKNRKLYNGMIKCYLYQYYKNALESRK